MATWSYREKEMVKTKISYRFPDYSAYVEGIPDVSAPFVHTGRNLELSLLERVSPFFDEVTLDLLSEPGGDDPPFFSPRDHPGIPGVSPARKGKVGITRVNSRKT